MHNPKTGFIHLETIPTEYNANNPIPWGDYPKVIDVNRYTELQTRQAAGKQHANEDQVMFDFYTNEWQDEANRAFTAYKTKQAGIITSTEFPAITVTTVQNALLRNEQLIAEKYNLLQITQTINTDQLWIIFPEYDDTTKAVRTGYKENDPIETVGWGGFTETRIGLEKSGAGIGFTEEFYMRQYTYPITQFILDHIAQDFVRVKHERLVALLSTFADISAASIGSGDWGAIGTTDLRSTNRPQEALNSVRNTIHTADRTANVNTLISRQLTNLDYELNTWTSGFLAPLTATTLSTNDTVASPRGIPWCQRWILNEDVTANNLFIFDDRAFVMLQGPRKTVQFENNNPQQTITIQKDWFKQHLRKPGWGRELTGVSA